MQEVCISYSVCVGSVFIETSAQLFTELYELIQARWVDEGRFVDSVEWGAVDDFFDGDFTFFTVESFRDVVDKVDEFGYVTCASFGPDEGRELLL